MKTEAEIERDIGIEKVRSHNSEWQKECIAFLYQKQPMGLFTGEDIRMYLLDNGYPNPSSPHAWGSLIRQLRDDRIIVETGRYVKMQLKQSHARRTAEYMFV